MGKIITMNRFKQYYLKLLSIFILMLVLISITLINNKMELNALNYESTYSKEELNNGVIYTEELEVINDGVNYYTDNIVYLNDSSDYFIIGNIVDGNKDDENEDKRYPYVSYYKDDSLQWSRVNQNYEYGEYFDGLFKENTILLYGTFGENHKKIFLCEYDLSGNLVKSTHYFNDGNTLSKKIYRYNNYYYLIGETNCNEFIYKNSGENSIFIAQLNSKYEICDICFLGNSGENMYLDSLVFGDHLKVLIKVGGEGYFDYEKSNPYIIVDFSFRMEVGGYEKINERIDDKCYLKDDGEYLYLFSYLNGEIIKSTYKENLTCLRKELFYKMDENPYLLSMNLWYDSNSKCWFLGFLYTTDKIYSEYVFIDDSLTIVEANREMMDGNKVFHNYYYNNGIIYVIGINHGFGNKLTYLAKKGLIKRINEKCYFNTFLLNEEKVNTENIFGYYDGVATYKFNNVTFKVEGGYYVDLKTNIKNNSTYDLGVVLYFNGNGNLNGAEIENGYPVTEVGNYVLEINGMKDRKYIHFIVEDLGIKENKSIYQELSYITYDDILSSEPIDEVNDTVYVPKTYELKYLYIGAGVLGFVLAFIPWRKKYT